MLAPDGMGDASVAVHGPPGLVEISPVGEDDESETVTGSPAVYAVPLLVSSSIVSGADVAPGATVCAEDMNASRDGFHASNVRQAVVAAAPPMLPVHQVVLQAASGRSSESAIAAASRTSTASVCALKSAVGMPVRFFGDHA